jgi:hypothetical protein
VYEKYFGVTETDDIDGGTTPLLDWSSFAAIYDSYRVDSVRIKFLPAYPGEGLHGAFLLSFDKDTSGTVPTQDIILNYPAFSSYSTAKGWTYYTPVPKYTSANTASVTLPDGFLDIAAPPATGSILLYANGLSVSTLYGKLLISYSITFANRR